MILKGYILIYGYLLLILGISSICSKVFKLRTIFTKKFIHISISFCYVIMYYYFGTSIHIIIPPISFIIINILSYKFGLFKAMEDGSGNLGTIYYPISVFIMTLITHFVPGFYPAFGIGLFCMAFGDGFAPLVSGFLRSRKIYSNKTVSGTATVFGFSLMGILIFNYIFKLEFSIFEMLVVSIVSALLELFDKKGLDNLFVPLGVSLLVYLLEVI